MSEMLTAGDVNFGARENVRPFVRRAPCGDSLTEAGAAERFVRLSGDDLRFDHQRGRWMLFSNHRFIPDVDAEVARRALASVRDWQAEALTIADHDTRQKTVIFALAMERHAALSNLLALAKTIKPVADDGQGWDRDPWALGVANGVLNLRTGALHDGRREHRLTMQTAVVYDRTAKCPRWERFLSEVFESHPELVPFLQRAIGYSLTGDVGEQCLFMLHGAGANGKSTLLQTLKYLFGDYALNTPFATIELNQRGGIPNDLAALVGRRLVMASETNDGARLNESRIKSLTGCDSITARFLHCEFFTFEPVAKFWLAVNHKPVVRDDSYGFWRRIRLIPFERRFELNPTLGNELKDEAAGILAWAVRGCLAWQERGLNPPAVVIESTKSYEAESDPLRDFIDEALEDAPGAVVRAGELYEHYQAHARRHGLNEREYLSATRFGKKMKERFVCEKDRAGWFYSGIARRL